MDSHGGSLYSVVRDEAQSRRASVLASLGVKA
jgi:L(+)-tartrate dehydratase beta subunit